MESFSRLHSLIYQEGTVLDLQRKRYYDGTKTS